MNQSKYIIKDTKEGQIDLVLLWRVLVQNFVLILVVGILLAGLLGAFRFLTNDPYYTADIKFIVSGVKISYQPDGQVTVTPNDTQGASVGTLYAKTAPHIIGGDNTIQAANEYLKEKYPEIYKSTEHQLSNRAIKGKLNVTVNDQIVTVRISDADIELVRDIAEAFESVVPRQMDYYYGLENAMEEGEYENVLSVAKALNSTPSDGTPVDELERRFTKTGRGSTLFAAIGFFLGAVAVYAICFARTYFDNTVYSEDDLKDHFTLPVVGQIPDWDNAENAGSNYQYGGHVGMKTEKDEAAEKKAPKKTQSARSAKKAKRVAKAKNSTKSAEKAAANAKNAVSNSSDRDYTGRLLTKNTPFAITEAFKSLRTNMCYTTKGEKCAVYGITSAYVQAGKSLVIANLAISFSMMDRKVLLLDGDLRCPVQHKIFNLSNHVHGFSDVLAGICSYDQMELRDGGYKNLSILTCGKIPPNPAELLASDNMKKFIERAKQDFDFIFIDLPPVSEVSDAGIISNLVTGFAFVVRAGHSDRRMVEMALECMEGFDAPMTGFILNDIDIKAGSYYKNKYYSYGKYGQYSKYSKYGYKYSHYGKNNKYGSNGQNSYADAYRRAAEEQANQSRSK